MVKLNNKDKDSIVYGLKTIDFSLFYHDRKTMEIAVHPDNTVVVKAPIQYDILVIKKKLNKRARWILRQMSYFKQFNPKTPDRCYVDGEKHPYLGKQYCLKLTEGTENSVKLSRGFFHITCRNTPTPKTVKKLLNQWYLEKARLQFTESMDRCWQKVNSTSVSKPNISIKQMQRRWGSLSSDKSTVTLNIYLIRVPKECIDYVVTHELCHMKHYNHSPEFYKHLYSIISDWKKIKNKLELSMM